MERRKGGKERGHMWLGREWGTLPHFPIPQHPLTHTPLPPVHHHHHWHLENDAAHLICQPSHFRCHDNISQDGSLWARLYSNDLAGSLSSSWHCWSIPFGSTDGTRGSWLKKDEEWGKGKRRTKRRWRFRINRISFNYSVLRGPPLLAVFNRRSATKS